MPERPYRRLGDQLQRGLRPLLSEHGFRAKGRTFRRETEDGLTHVVHLQLGQFDPPAWTPIPGLRESLYGSATVNLGVYVPEVNRLLDHREPKTIQEYDCCIRDRLGVLSDGRDIWWELTKLPEALPAIQRRLLAVGLPFLDRYRTRQAILERLEATQEEHAASRPPLIVCALIRYARGERQVAHALLHRQYVGSADHRGHREYLQGLAQRLGLDALAPN